ncbi:hypothetical protein SAMN04490205_2471 [Pseudomonas trivialis]|uniref:ATPase n=1 Tax=Pseudomonas trivialis TaxID=200450 RepID=A0ABY0UC65_9PSED|nr:hypothetical protein SAMN04490205_2471 [Pseudomonas trivialis]
MNMNPVYSASMPLTLMGAISGRGVLVMGVP